MKCVGYGRVKFASHLSNDEIIRYNEVCFIFNHEFNTRYLLSPFIDNGPWLAFVDKVEVNLWLDDIKYSKYMELLK